MHHDEKIKITSREIKTANRRASQFPAAESAFVEITGRKIIRGTAASLINGYGKNQGYCKNMARCVFMVSENNDGILQKKTMQRLYSLAKTNECNSK